LRARRHTGAVSNEHESAAKWWLITQLPPSNAGSQGELDILREVASDELRQTQAANALLTRLAHAAPYARLVELYHEIELAIGRGSSPKRTAADMNRAARALGKVAASFPEELRRHAPDGLSEGELAALEQAIQEECARAPFRVLVAVGALASGPFAAVDGGAANDPAAIAALTAVVAEVMPAINLTRTLRTGVLVAQRLIGRQLEIYEEAVNEASLFLRRLAAEVADGVPALMRADQLDPSTGKIEIGQATFEQLALDKAIYLHRALRLARPLLQATAGAAVVPTEAAEAEATADLPADVTDPVDSEEPLAATVAADEPSEDGEESAEGREGEALADPEAAAAEPPPGAREDQLLDLRALAAHASELTDELEHAWSDALEPEALTAAQTEFNARFASLLYSLQRRVAAADRTLRSAGIDPEVAAFPLPADDLARLTFTPDEERRWRQLQMAELESLMALLVAVEAMRAPSAHRVTLATGATESWWEAGAFALVRARLRLLVRVSEAAAAAESQVMKQAVSEEDGAPQDGPHDFFDRLRFAGEALGNGDPEAALVHGLIALRLRVELEGVELPDDLLERLADDVRLGDEAPLLRLLAEAAATLGAGRALDVGAAVLVVPRALGLIGRLCLEMPEILLAARRVEETDGS
jgi:hypothetical protein